MTRIRIGQIGISHEHAAAKMRSLRTMDDRFEVVGVVDDRASRAARFPSSDMTPYEGLPWLSEEELFAVTGLQAVMVETANLDLVPTARRCMERDLAIHMDKPGGQDLASFRKLLASCQARNLPFQMGYMLRGNPALQWCMQALREGWLGEVFAIHAGMSHNYGDDAYQRYLASFPGGILFNLGCHLIDTVVAMLGRPTAVTSFLTSTPGTPANSMNNGLAILGYPHAHVQVHACSREVDGLRHRRFTLCGTRGTVELAPLERFDGQPLTMRLTLLEDTPTYPAGTHILDFGVQQDRYRDQLLEFAQVIDGKLTNPWTYQHDDLVQEVLLAASGYTTWGPTP